MTDKQINRWLRRRFSRIGWLLLLYYGLMTLMTSLTTGIDLAKQTIWSFAAGDFSGSVNWDVIYGNAWGYIVSILMAFAILDAWKGTAYWKQEILVREKPMQGRTFLCFLLFCMGAQMMNSLWITVLELLLNPLGKSVMPVLESMYTGLNRFASAHSAVFQDNSAAAAYAGSLSRYHSLLRGQLAAPVRKFCPDDFSAEFVAEAMLTWTIAGKSLEEISALVTKLM